MNEPKTFTYQTRIRVDGDQERLLDAYADLYGRVERNLFAELIQEHDLALLKRTFIPLYDITARQFNACRVSLQGKINSVKEARIRHISLLKNKIVSLEKNISKIRNKLKRHRKQRHLIILKDKLIKLEQDHKDGTISLCFGGRQLYHAQYNLEANGYSSLEEWKKDWKKARSSEFFCLGSSDETAGNQSCVLTFDENGKGALRLRLPGSLIKEGIKYLVISNLFFSYGQKEIQKALSLNQALSYRFKKDEKGWRVFISFKQEAVSIITKELLGAIGVDINANHIAITKIDAKGNPIHKETLPLNTYGTTKNQAKALIGDVCKKIVNLAKETCKPLVLENLDFAKKKEALKESLPKYARMLSSFSYSSIIQTLSSRGFREGVELFTVNPAMTSIIGKIKFAKRYGLSTHHAAALCIARRHFRFSEAPSKKAMTVVFKNTQVTCPLPARKRGQHVWGFWRSANRKLQAALAAYLRASPHPS